MRPWERIYNDLERASARLGYAPPRQLGAPTSQCFEYHLAKRRILFVGFRDVARDPSKYSADDHLWVEGFGPILREYGQILSVDGDAELPPAYGIVIDNVEHKYVTIDFSLLVLTYNLRVRLRTETIANLTFGVLRAETGYILQTPRGVSNIGLEHVNTVRPLVDALRAARAKQQVAAMTRVLLQ